MRRPKVHRVEGILERQHPETLDWLPEWRTYRTRCGITGGSELLNLTGINNGGASFCAECWPGATSIRRNVGYRALPEQRWQ